MPTMLKAQGMWWNYLYVYFILFVIVININEIEKIVYSFSIKFCYLDTINFFPCPACGKCCRRVNLSPETAYLDRGDGACQYFNEQTNLCSIYDKRPLVCRVEEYYKAHLSHIYSWEEFIKLNLEVCEKL